MLIYFLLVSGIGPVKLDQTMLLQLEDILQVAVPQFVDQELRSNFGNSE